MDIKVAYKCTICGTLEYIYFPCYVYQTCECTGKMEPYSGGTPIEDKLYIDVKTKEKFRSLGGDAFYNITRGRIERVGETIYRMYFSEYIEITGD